MTRCDRRSAFMSLSSLALSVMLLAPQAGVVDGTRVGDRHHGNTETGFFYIFGPEISIVDPVTGDIVKTLPGSTDWGDTVYMRDHAQINHYVFANDGDNHDLWVIDTDAQEVLSQVDTGDNPVHLYAIPSREEIWTHPDDNGTFDILHLGDLDYLAHSNLKVHEDLPGHGKLLWDPNLQDQAFATNTKEPHIYELDLDERVMTNIVNMTLESAPYPCNRTHGIAYSYVNQHLYVECSHPETCANLEEEGSYSDGTICSGATWEVDAATRTPVARLISPALNALYGDSYGTQGQIYSTPDERFAVVANKYQNYVHFLQPLENQDTRVIDVPVDLSPGKVVFWPKDGADAWGPDSSVTDFWVVIAQEAQVDGSGIVMIDLELVYNAFEAGGDGSDIEVVQIVLGPGALYRPVARGSHYAVTPTNGQDDYGGYTAVAIVDLETQELLHTVDIAEAKRVQWVPTHDDEKVADHEIRIEALESSLSGESATASSGGSSSGGTSSSVETMAEAGLALGVVGFCGALAALVIAVRNARHAKRVSNGEFKPFACV